MSELIGSDKPLSKQIALVTGGSRGIGRAISLKLAELGAHVYVNFTSQEQAAQQVVDLCLENGGSAQVLGFDVADSAAVDQAIDKIKTQHAKLDILINNAGISRDGLLMRMKDQDWQRTLDVNLSGAFYCCRAASRLMMRAKSGRIINISSVVGEMGNAGQAAYVASKAGLIGLTKSMARELSSRNILVNAITPGFIETDMTQALTSELKEQHMTMIPLGRYGQAEEIAAVVAFLAGDGSAYITGQVIAVNGGMYM